MKTTSWDFLFSPTGPWIYVGVPELEASRWIESCFYSRAGVDSRLIKLRGGKLHTVQALMNEFGAAFQLFDGFGENWYALRDCLRCLDEWMKAAAYVLLITSAHEVLKDELEIELVALLKTLDECGRFWAEPINDADRFDRDAIPFHTLFLTRPEFLVSVKSRFANASAVAGTEIRV